MTNQGSALPKRDFQEILPPIFENVNVKLLLYTSKIRYPKYPALFYPFYMYLIYRQLLKRKKQFKIKVIPDDLMLYVLNKYPSNFNYDLNNCVIVSSLFCSDVDLGKYAKIRNNLSSKLVQIFGYNVPYDTIYISDTLHHNFNENDSKERVSLTSIQPTTIRIAEEVEVRLISSGYDVTNHMSDTLLKNYFKCPKLVQKDNIITINVKQYAPEFTYNSCKTNSIENVYFKCCKIKYGNSEDCVNAYFCINGDTELKQSAHVQDYLPARLKKYAVGKFTEDFLENSLMNRCPYGFEERLDRLRRAVKPFIKHKKIKLKPVFLVQGSKGNGKNILASCLADELGLNFCKVSSGDLSASAYAQTEIKIKNAFFKAKLCAPSMFVINNFENFGRNNEGQFDQRIIDYFKVELCNNLTNNNPPIVILCISNSKDLPVELSRVFLEVFDFGAPDQEERAKLLDWLLEAKRLKARINVDDVAGKTHGFLYGDLEALVYYALRNRFETNGNCSEEDQVTTDDFTIALDIMQSNYTDSMGAPRVPRVQWSDVGGLSDVKHEIIRTINLPLKHPDLLKSSGLRRSGILLYGPPGTGKTLLAKAVATECGLCFLSVKGPELLNMYVGQSEQNVREVFDRAREASPCIIFFDELDSLAPNRGISGDSGGVMDRVVSQLLSEMDGLNREATVFIIGATNRPDLIDPALLRPGRFDKLLYVGPADTKAAKLSVLTALTRKFNLSEDTNLKDIVDNCPENISGADFYGICSNAWMSAVRRMIGEIENGKVSNDNVSHKDIIVKTKDFEEALNSVKPSISTEDLKYFNKLKLELSANTYT